MKGDYSRLTFKAAKHYAAVLEQQGRLSIDPDWNEAVAINQHLRETTTRDVIGASGVPKYGGGFEIGLETDSNNLVKDLTISKGRIYVDGILCELDDDDSTYTDQLDYPGAELKMVDGQTDLIYLDVWQRHITVIEDPDLREVALGGPDTTTRLQTVCQVKIKPNVGATDCNHQVVPDRGASLTVKLLPTPDNEPCDVAPGGGYKGLENHLYRVEVHDGDDPGPATFKWSRDNGSVAVAIEAFVNNEPKQVRVARLGWDEVLALRKNDWVEVLDDDTELTGVPGTLTQIKDIKVAERILILDQDVKKYDTNGHPRVRRWDQAGPAIKMTMGKVTLEHGIQVDFIPAGLMTGDFWTFAARVGNGSTPGTLIDPPTNAPPMGIQHHYCNLAFVTWAAEGQGFKAQLKDCRKEFPPLTDLPEGQAPEITAGCCQRTVGIGGDFATIQAAVDDLAYSKTSGQICILPGTYSLDKSVVVENLDVTFSGCGPYTIISNNSGTPAFLVKESSVRFLDLAIETLGASPAAVECRQCGLILIERCKFSSAAMVGTDAETLMGWGPAIYTGQNSNHVVVRDCEVKGLPAVVCQAEHILLQGNRINDGGIWLEDGCRAAEVANNTISNGGLQGITLGGLRLSDAPVSGGLDQITIRGNRIKNMDLSAIGSVSLSQGLEAIGQIRDLTIADNFLESCGYYIEVDSQYDGHTLGGIVLNGVRSGRITRNSIAKNGENQVPACGICLTLCMEIEIANNRIIGNGVQSIGSEEMSDITLQAGILALYVLDSAVNLQSDVAVQPGPPALKVHDNIVVTPAGPCLTAVGLGPISVRDNAFASRAVYRQPNLPDDPDRMLTNVLFEGRCVSIFNLARSVVGGQDHLPVGGNVELQRDQLFGSLADFSAASEEQGIIPASQLAYHGNQSTQAMSYQGEGPFAEPAVVLVSFGDVAAQDNQHVTFLDDSQQLTDWRVLGVTLRVQDNWVEEGPERALFSIVSYGSKYANASDNQADHCIYVAGGNVVDRDNQTLDPEACRTLAEDYGDALPK